MQGLKYPLEIAKGGLVLTKRYENLVEDAIQSSVRTRTEERVMRPEYGREDEEFQAVNSIVELLGNLRRAIVIGLEGYPEVVFELSGAINEMGLVDVTVGYSCPEGVNGEVVIEGL